MNQNNVKRLIVIVGPTGAGKSALAALLANKLGNTPVLSCDSRQFYKEMCIGTAVPNAHELELAQHYFIQDRSVDNPCDAGAFEREALSLISELHETHDNIVMVGGSGLYVDAVCRGFDDLPEASEELRQQINSMTQEQRLDMLLRLDPEYYLQVDKNNSHRVQRALEVCLSSGQKYSSLRTGCAKERNFQIIKIGVNLPREVLYDRINKRVDMMMAQGLEQEAMNLYPKRHLSSLQTVGYREIFDAADNKTTMEQAIELIKRNSRRYAKRQITWFSRDLSTAWYDPNDLDAVLNLLDSLE